MFAVRIFNFTMNLLKKQVIVVSAFCEVRNIFCVDLTLSRDRDGRDGPALLKRDVAS